MEALSHAISAVNGVVWGPVILILGTGLFLQAGLKMTPILKLGFGFRLLWKGRTPPDGREGEISPFNTLMASLSATIGTGNIAGVATAIFLGGIKRIAQVAGKLVPFMAIAYQFGVKSIMPFRIPWCLAAPIGAMANLSFIWLLADTLNALMAIPNLIALILLSPVVFQVTREFFANDGVSEEQAAVTAD